MAKHTSEVQGRLLRWARVEQDITMRWIQDQGGPSIGYQSEVEQGKKKEVTTGLLLTWVGLLQVTEAFACGQVPTYQENPGYFRGLALRVGERVRRVPEEKWGTLTAQDRTSRVLKLVARDSGTLPKVVLAHVLGLRVRTLEDMLAGQHPIMEEQMQVLSVLTGLPEAFFRAATLEAMPEAVDPGVLKAYLPALRRALRAGISPTDLETLIEKHG